jgi:FUS-interacting serine-arginine-rich protein 1
MSNVAISCICLPGYGPPGRGPPPPHGGPPSDRYGPGGGGPQGPHGPPGRGPPPPGKGERRRGRDEGPPGVSLLVRNVAPTITTEDLQTAFGRIGEVRDVYIPRDYHSQQPKGFAFIEYANPDMALEAREEMDRFKVKGRELEVVFAQERRKTPNEMRGRSGSDPHDAPAEFERSSSFERHRQRQRDGGRDRRDRHRDNGDRRDGPRGGESSKGEKDVRPNEGKPVGVNDEWV